MAAFDPARLQPSKYNLNDPIDAAKFQRMVSDFMDLVREDDSEVSGRKELAAFRDMVMDEQGWHLAVMVVPEFQRPQ
jgi:hypothetical protein